MTPPARISAIVLAGGRATRLGGASKPDIDVNGARLLDIALAAARPACSRVIVVGPPSLAGRGAAVVREDPPFGGPVAGLAAGLDALDALEALEALEALDHDLDGAEWVLVLPVDLARAGGAVALLVAALAGAGSDGVDGLHLVDAGGAPQWLTALYRRSALRTVLEGQDQGQGQGQGQGRQCGGRGRSMRSVVGGLRLAPVPDPEGAGADIDTWADVEQQRSQHRPPGHRDDQQHEHQEAQ